jgi:hypothetical protein
MKTKTCYFCSSALDNIGCCQACKDKYDLNYVYTEYININDNGDLKLYYSRIQVPINEKQYNIVLMFLDLHTHTSINETRIYLFGAVEHIATLPICSWNLANIKNKLKLYLLFS